MAKELIIMPNWIGDCALALSVVHRKMLMQNADVTLLIPHHLAQLCAILSGLPVISWDRNSFREKYKVLRQIRSLKFNAVYVIPHSFSSAFFSFLTGIKKRRGVDKELRRFFFTQALPYSLRNRTLHITYEYALVLETDFVPPDYWQGVGIDKSVEHSGKIIFCPGAMYGKAKQWTGFAKLAQMLPSKKIVVLGDKRDNDIAVEIHNSAPENVVNLAGKTDLLEACRIIAGASVVVSNDSGLMHLAGYCGTPVIGIFGSTSPLWTRPLGAKAKIASVKCECSPCLERTCRYKHYACMNLIKPAHVQQLVSDLIEDSTHNHGRAR